MALLIQYGSLLYFASILVKVPWRRSEQRPKHVGNKTDIFYFNTIFVLIFKNKWIKYTDLTNVQLLVYNINLENPLQFIGVLIPVITRTYHLL